MGKAREKEEGLKPFTTRFNRDEWLFLKQQAARQETSMQKIIRGSVKLYRKMLLNRLTNDDTIV